MLKKYLYALFILVWILSVVDMIKEMMERLQALELKQKSMESAEWDENQRLRATIDSQQKVIDYLENKGRLKHSRMYLGEKFCSQD